MLTRLVRQSSVYALAGILGKASGLVLTAYYVNTEYLPVEDYGYFGVIRAAMMTALLAAGAGLPLGVIRSAASRALREDVRASVPSTALVLAALSGAVVGLAVWVSAPLVAGLLGGGGGGRAEPVRLVALYLFFKAVADVSYAELRQREKVRTYVAMSAAESLVLLGAVLWFLVVEQQGLVGVMRGYAVSSAFVAGVSSVLLLRVVPWRPRWSLAAPLASFGLPLVLSGLAMRFLYFGDRFVIVHVAGLESSATYELAAQFGALVHTVLVQGVQLAFTVTGIKVFGDPAAAALYRRSFRHFAALAGGAVLGVGLFASAVVRLVTTDPAYVSIDGVVALVAGGFAFNGLYAIPVSALYAAGRTRTVALCVGAAAALNLALNLALVPTLGIVGAAFSTLAAYAALALVVGHVAAPLAGTRLPWGAVVGVTIATASLWALGDGLAPGGPFGLGLRAGALGIYPLALVGLGVYGRGDLEAVRIRVRERLGRPPSTPR